jgi:hypothetical protein
MKKKSQKGSAHAIIIAVLFVALMATLGVVFYQNFIAKKDTDTKPQDTSSNTDVLQTARVAYASSIYELDHPNEWTATSEKVKSGSLDGNKLVVVNKDGTVRVTVEISNRTRTDACNTADELKLSYYDVHETAVKNLAPSTLFLVESISDATDGGYTYKIGLTPDGGDTHTSIGTSHCTVQHVGEVSNAIKSGAKITQPAITATIDFPLLLAVNETKVKSMQPVKDLIATGDYKAAVAIIESARKK